MTTAQIQSLVCAYYGVKRSDLLGHRRTEALAWARHVAIWLACETIGRHRYGEQAKLARPFNRNHASVTYAVERVRETIATYPKKAAEVSGLLRDVAGFQRPKSNPGAIAGYCGASQ